MLKMLLDRGADPNEPVKEIGGKTVLQALVFIWYQFILGSIPETDGPREKETKLSLFQACEMMIEYGAQKPDKDHLLAIFRGEEGERLLEKFRIAEYHRKFERGLSGLATLAPFIPMSIGVWLGGW